MPDSLAELQEAGSEIQWTESERAGEIVLEPLLKASGQWYQLWSKGGVFMLSCFSCVQFFAALWTVACQAPLSIEFSRQEYWSGLPFSSPGDLPGPGIEPASPVLADGFFTTSTTWEAPLQYSCLENPMDGGAW